jgi:hypothetical protein
MKMHDFEMLPELAFKPTAKGRLSTLWGKGGGSSAPDADPNIGIAQRELSKLATEQWAEFKTKIYPDLQKQTDAQNARLQGTYDVTQEAAKKNLARADESYAMYKESGIPAMEKLRDDANKYNEEAYQEQLASQAAGDIGTAAQVQREQTAMRQRSYGIDPTSGVAQAQANSNQVAQAAATAAAMNQTREAAKQVGLQKQANVYNMYAGLPAQSLQQTNVGLGANSQGAAAGQSMVGNAAAVSGVSNAATQTAMGGWGQVGTLGVQKYQADVGAYQAQQQAEGQGMAGLGSLAGQLGSVALKSYMGGSDINIKQDINKIGKLDNGFPLYSFQYKPEYQDVWGHGFIIGVMAQDVEKVLPDAVSIHPDGYKMVDYGKVLNHGA